MRLKSVVLLAALSLASCGAPVASNTSSEPPPRPEPTPDPPPEAPLLALHEWGLVDVDLARGLVELSAGPGMPARPVVARKPVIYAHLIDREAASIDLRVRLADGASVLEHWPATHVQGTVLPWHLDVRRGPCAIAAARDLPAACAAPDGYCEVSELPRYVTSDHDCIEVGGERVPLLFYRASIPMDALSLRVEGAAGGALRVTSTRARGAGPRTIVRISTALSGPWPPGHVVIARADLPSEPGSVEVPLGQEALDPAAERTALERALTGELGLTADEARVFLEAWSEELFGAVPSARESTRRWSPARAQDVLLYWLGQDEVDRIARLDASPHAITTRRAFLVRVVLPAVPTAGPAAP